MSNTVARFTVKNGGTVAVVEGDIDEETDLGKLASQLVGSSIALDLGGVRRINSLGIRCWIAMLRTLQGKTVSYLRCSPAVVELLSCIEDFRGHASVASVLLPYSCDACGNVLYEERTIAALGGTGGIPPNMPCPSCGGKCLFDDAPDRYVQLAKLLLAMPSP